MMRLCTAGIITASRPCSICREHSYKIARQIRHPASLVHPKNDRATRPKVTLPPMSFPPVPYKLYETDPTLHLLGDGKQHIARARRLLLRLVGTLSLGRVLSQDLSLQIRR